jgi:hypothetical protein
MEIGGVYTQWLCQNPDDLFGITDVYGDGPTTIFYVDSTASASVANEVLGFIATLPYQGAQPDSARARVEENISRLEQGTVLEDTFGGVHYQLSGNDQIVTLEIGMLE